MRVTLSDTREDFAPPRSEAKECGAWLALARVKGLGCGGFKKLAEYFGDPRSALSASEKDLARVPGLDKRAVSGLVRFSEWDEVHKELESALDGGVKIVPYTDPCYPNRLRLISDPPPFLYVKGELKQEDGNSLAVVGSRSASDYGLSITRDLCRGLASLGFTLVSGMARGIDGAAHRAALEAGGRTVAVLGSGVDVAYPWEHERLYHQIVESGAVVSELRLGTAPLSYHFPARNRLISGLSLGVVVVEATEKSGSLITARFALEQNREVFAVPGQAGASRSRGTHRLIRQGAKLVESVEDIVEEIAPQLRERSRSVEKNRPISLPPDMSLEAKTLFDLILGGSCQIDELIQASTLSAARVSELLLDLEIRGFLKQLPGKIFRVN